MQVEPTIALPYGFGRMLTLLLAFQTTASMGKDLQTCHICRANLFKSKFQDYEPPQATGAGPHSKRI